MRMNVDEYARWLTARTNSHRARYAASDKPDPVKDPMYAYRKVMPSGTPDPSAATRAADAMIASAIARASSPSGNRAYFRQAPPDGYAIALKKENK
jgi:hypothetical protein